MFSIRIITKYVFIYVGFNLTSGIYHGIHYGVVGVGEIWFWVKGNNKSHGEKCKRWKEKGKNKHSNLIFPCYN